ncbi:MAG: hypothetical protein CMJ84_13515 [Planctomycetes bacterium]|nr:hypothetical protein [Planctomycetota bacterium]
MSEHDQPIPRSPRPGPDRVLGVLSRRLAGACAALGLLGVALGAALSFPRAVSEGRARPALRALLIDASASATRCRSTWSSWARRILSREARAALDAGEHLAVVLYGADTRELFPPGPPERILDRLAGRDGAPLSLLLEGRADTASELARALGLVEDELGASDRAPSHLRLVGEATWTGRDPAGALARLARAGVTIERLAPPAPDLPDLAVGELTVPSAPAVGEPLAISVDLALAPGAGGVAAFFETCSPRLEVRIESAAGASTRLLPLAAPLHPRFGSRGYLTWPLRLDLGPVAGGRTLVRVKVRVEGPGALRAGDPVEENDTLACVVTAGERRLAVAVASEEAAPDLAAWLDHLAGPADLQWLVRRPEQLAGLAGHLDLLLTLDLPLARLPATFVERFVASGGGWLHCAGWTWLEAAGTGVGSSSESGGAASSARAAEAADRLASMLPLRPAVPDAPERSVVFLIDGSGSMAGEPFERVKGALAELAGAAAGGDEMQLCLFTGALHDPVPLVGRRALARLLATTVPGGPTAILYSLEQLARRRSGAALPGVVILLSDGRDSSAFDIEERAAALRVSLAASRTRLAVVAVGENADRDLLGALLPAGVEPISAGDLGELTEIFHLEVNRERVLEGPGLRVVPADPASLASLPPAASALEAMAVSPVSGWPTFHRAVRAEARGGAGVLWKSAEGDPLLAVQRVGAGLVAAWASAPLADWSPEWGAATALTAPLLRALARRDGRGEELTARAVGGELVLSAFPDTWPALLRAEVLLSSRPVGGAGAVEATLGTIDLAPPATPVGLDPGALRTAPLPVFLGRASPASVLRLEVSDARGAYLGQAPLVLARAAEFSLRPERLGELPAPVAGERRVRPNGRRRAHPAAPTVLGAGLGCLFLAGALGLFRRSGSGPELIRTKKD